MSINRGLLMLHADQMCLNAEAESRPTVANLHVAAKRLSKWRDVAIGTCRAKPDEFLQTEQRLNDLWKGLGWSRDSSGASE